MKIFSFNEAVEYWTFNKIEKLHDDNSDLSDFVIDFLDLMNKSPKDKKSYHLSEFWFEPIDDEEDEFNVFYEHSGFQRTENFSYEFSKNEFQELLKYMNNPEVYKNANKYNL